MKSSVSPRWRYLASLGLVLSLLTTLLAAAPPTARAGQSLPATIVQLQRDPQRNTMWALWYDQPAALNNTAYIGQFEPDRFSGIVTSVPRQSALLPQSGFVLLPEARRFYYGNFLPSGFSSSSLLGVASHDLDTWNTTLVTSTVDLTACGLYLPALERYKQPLVVYNPELKHVYFPCYADPASGKAALVIDLNANKIIGTLPYIPLAYNPVNHRLYALQYYANDLYTLSNNIDLLALDAATEKPSSDPLLIEKYGPAAWLNSVLVNSRSGDVFVTRSTCFAKCAPVSQAVFNKSGQQTQNWSETATSGYLLLNEATNQLYGRHWNGNYIAVDGSNLAGGQLAAFGWTPLAVITQANELYAVDNRDGDSPLNPSRGMGIVKMNGSTYDITDYFTVRPPDPFFFQNADKLSGPPANFQGMYFKETGHTLSGKFLTYWQSHGGLAIFGYPITEVFFDFNSADGKIYQVQYFERNRFELHPENAGTPYEVQLGLLGKYFSAVTGPEVQGRFGTGETEAVPGGLRFKETGHTLTGKFLEYWQSHGGLAIFGLPLTEPFKERNPLDGQIYLMQYFERNRFELHPEFAGTPYEVELGLLGNQLLKTWGWFRPN